jgi:thiosulfate/3-mercaptopyruvate sulfurtransferase
VSGPLVDPAWLRGRLGEAGLAVVDCRWRLGEPGAGERDYRAGHVPGAAFLDVDRDLSAEPGPAGRHPLPPPDAFERAARRAGIGRSTLVVAYDEAGEGGATRLWWLLRHFGHEDCAVLRGGIEAWQGPLQAGEEAVETARFEPRPGEDDTLSADEIADRLGDERLVIVDARIESRWRGEPNPIDKVPGRIPGAINIPFTDDEPLPDALLTAEEIVVYCGSGVTSCVPLLRLAEAGRPDAKLYPGSWSQWEGLGGRFGREVG